MAYPISDVPRRIVYSGSAGVGPYAFTFEVLANTDIAVYKNTTLLTLTTDYTVSINTGTGTGTVTLVVAATGADTVTIVGDRAIRRTSDFVTGGDLFANTLNEELDAQTIYTQQVDEKADRAIKIPVTDPTNLSMTLPSQASRAQKLLGFNASGEPTAYVATTTVSDTSLINFTQAGTGAVTRTAQAKMRDVVSVLDFGADPTGVADSTTAIQNAINAAVAANARVVGQGTFRTSSKITIKCDADFSQAIFNVYSTPAIAVEISTGSAANPTDNLFNVNVWMPLEINNMTKPSTGWAGQGIGVRTVNLNSCRVFFNQIKNFATGLLVTAYSEGNAYNEYHIGALINNQINLQLYANDAGGYVNENNFYGGRFFFYSAEGTNVSGTRHISIPTALSATGIQNNNIFYKPSLEGDTPEYHIENAGQYNTFVQGRYESSPSKVLYVGDTAAKGTFNVINGGYTAGNIVFSYSGSSSSFDNQVNLVPDKNIVSGSSNDGVFRYKNSAGSASPIYSFFPANVKPETATSTQWTVQHSAADLKGKLTADAHERVKIDYQNGLIYLGLGSATPAAYFGNNTATQMGVYAANGFVPLVDATVDLGRSGLRWATVYAATGTINTSDEREKQDISELDAAEKRVAIALKGLVKKFRFKDAVQTKGDAARIHVGVIAQEVISAFEAESLDPMRYGIVCYDQWDAQPEKLDADGKVLTPSRPAGDRYGVRYEELLAFIIAAL